MKLTLNVRYPDGYPDTLPELILEPTEGELEDDELQHLLQELDRVVSHLRVCDDRIIHVFA